MQTGNFWIDSDGLITHSHHSPTLSIESSAILTYPSIRLDLVPMWLLTCICQIMMASRAECHLKYPTISCSLKTACLILCKSISCHPNSSNWVLWVKGGASVGQTCPDLITNLSKTIQSCSFSIRTVFSSITEKVLGEVEFEKKHFGILLPPSQKLFILLWQPQWNVEALAIFSPNSCVILHQRAKRSCTKVDFRRSINTFLWHDINSLARLLPIRSYPLSCYLL